MVSRMNKKIFVLFLISVFISIFSFSCRSAEAAAKGIISLYPGHTDNIVALGGESLLIAVSKNDDKNIVPKLPRFSAKSGAEELLALKPDLLLTRGLAERQNPQLRGIMERAGVKVVSIDPPTWNEFPAYLRNLANLIGTDPEAASEQLNKIRKNIETAAKKGKTAGKQPSVFVEATSKDLHTCSPDSWAAKLIALAGGRNAAEDAVPMRRGSAVAPYGLERVLKAASDGKIDVYLVQHGAMNAADESSLASRSWYPAIKNLKIAVMPESELSRPSLLGLEAGGRRLIKIFYGK